MSPTIERGRDDATGANVPLPTADYVACFTIYENPKDLPGKYVLRECRMTGGRIVHRLSCDIVETLEAARALVPAGRVNMGRQPGDDPVIREVWL